MGVSYAIDRERHIVRSHGSGVLTLRCIQEFYSSLKADLAFESTYSCLGDLRAISEVAITASQIAASASLSIFAPGTRRAFIATSDVVYGVLRAYAAYNGIEGQEVRVFRDLVAAELWLETGDDRLLCGA
jgi:hypothetical protein